MAGLVDRRLGKASAKRVPFDRAEEVERLYRERYPGFMVSSDGRQFESPPLHQEVGGNDRSFPGPGYRRQFRELAPPG
jgi:hypothetical protein